MAELLDPSTLQTVHHFAADYRGSKGVTPSYIYRLIREKRLPSFVIDGTVFVVVPPRDSIPMAA